MNQAALQSDVLTATPGTPFIHVAGDLIVRVESNPLSGLAHLLSSPIAGEDAVIQRGAKSSETDPRKILADGTEVPASDPRTDHVAVLYPDTGWVVAREALSRDGQPFSTQQDVEEAAKSLRLLGHDDWFLAPDKVYERHVIDRRYHKPAADKNLFPDLPLSDWYWTSTIAPWSSASAFFVNLSDGNVGDYPRDLSGFGLACRRSRQ